MNETDILMIVAICIVAFIALMWLALPFIVNSHAKTIIKQLSAIQASLQSLQKREVNAIQEPAKYIKSDCTNCGQPIEFNAAHIGQTIPCPHCKASTILGSQVPA